MRLTSGRRLSGGRAPAFPRAGWPGWTTPRGSRCTRGSRACRSAPRPPCSSSRPPPACFRGVGRLILDCRRGAPAHREASPAPLSSADDPEARARRRSRVLVRRGGPVRSAVRGRLGGRGVSTAIGAPGDGPEPAPFPASAAARGSVNAKAVSRPTWLSARIEQPWSLRMLRTMDRPRPSLPRRLRLRSDPSEAVEDPLEILLRDADPVSSPRRRRALLRRAHVHPNLSPVALNSPRSTGG